MCGVNFVEWIDERPVETIQHPLSSRVLPTKPPWGMFNIWRGLMSFHYVDGYWTGPSTCGFSPRQVLPHPISLQAIQQLEGGRFR